MVGSITAGTLSASTYVVGTSVTVPWSFSCLGGSNVNIYLCHIDLLCTSPIAEWDARTASLASATITIPSSVTTGSNYYFWIGDATNKNGVYGKSAYFSITAACTGSTKMSHSLRQNFYSYLQNEY